MTKLYLKKYITIYKALNKICIGFVGNEEEYLEMEYNSVNYELLEHLLKNGVDEIELFTFPYDELFKKGFMEIKATDGFSNSRSELYLNYLLGPAKSSFTAKNKKILIFGAGAGGSTLVYLLAQFGFNNIYIVDFDDVEESDLYRVITFDKIDLGEKKNRFFKKKNNE